MADRIALTGLKVRGNHGVFDHEKRDGQDFSCDITLWLDFGAAAASDDLADTVDYGAVAQIAHDVIAGPARDLIETVAVEIAEKLLAADGAAAAAASRPPLLHAVEVTIHKPQAPISLEFGDVAVTARRSRKTQRAGARRDAR
ncbi:dihydroneopterin aldolase [Corynebacterium xerosis]|uniref:dihydroneopterin aldolase n=1 Tax=Corynebacterium xerosis TaxID=1725 RepID=UPI000EB3F620|nr:dihydroneopterin aldolase [Corynebacterium xerosis]AYJ33623.1 dihydroneopterin aldolase [Corynebacterium xerosis]